MIINVFYINFLCISSHAWALRDDVVRLEEQKTRLSRCPLGSGAIAGCALAIDRARLAHSLGFKDVTPNSMFAVSSRDHFGRRTNSGILFYFLNSV